MKDIYFTYESIFVHLIYKGKLSNEEYITMSQLDNGRMILSILMISFLSFLIGVYGKIILSVFFIIGGVYHITLYHLKVLSKGEDRGYRS